MSKLTSSLVKEKLVEGNIHGYGDICKLLEQTNWKTNSNAKDPQRREWSHYFSWTKPTSKKFLITEIHNIQEYDTIKDSKLTTNLVKQQLVIDASYTFSELCKFLGESTEGSRNAKIKKWKRFFKWKRDGNIYIITDIYDVEQGYAKKVLEDSRFLVSSEDADKNGVYIIQLDNQVYIGSTTDGYRDRFRKHRYKKSTLQEVVTMLGQGATFDALCIAVDGATEEEIREVESYYIYLCKNSNYDCVNTRIHTYCCSKSA